MQGIFGGMFDALNGALCGMLRARNQAAGTAENVSLVARSPKTAMVITRLRFIT